MKKKYAFSIVKLIVFLAIIVLIIGIVPNWLLAPKLKRSLLEEINQGESRQGEVGSLYVNLFTTTVIVNNMNVQAVENEVEIDANFPRTSVRMNLKDLLQGRLKPQALKFTEPVLIIREPVGASLAASLDTTGPSARFASSEYIQASFFPALPSLLAVSQGSPEDSLTVEEAIVEEGTLIYEYLGDPNYRIEIDRIEILLEEIVVDESELRECVLRQLIGYWPGDEQRGIDFKGKVVRSGEDYQANLQGDIRHFPLASVREPINREYDIDIHSGTVDLTDNHLVLRGLVLDSTHTLVVRDLELNMRRSFLHTEESDYGNLVVELLRLTSGGDEHRVRDIRLHGDFGEGPQEALEEMAQQALDQIATTLANDLIDRFRHEKNKMKDKLKDIGKSLLEALEN